MKTLDALKEGLKRSLKAWKGILIVWIFYLSFISLLVVPLRSSMKAGFGRSMITEKLLDGFNIEVFSDLENVARTLMSSFASGLFFALLLGIILNAFLSGGLFGSLKAGAGRFSAPEFFRTSARYFWTFLSITLIISFIVLLLTVIIVVVPVALFAQSEPDSEKILFIVGIITGTVFLLILLILLLVTDYARAWIVARENPVCFKAIGFALGRTFEKFGSSYPLMLIINAAQLLFAFLVLFLVGAWKPVSGWGVFLLFLVSQFLFIVKILIKAWRYAGVTNLMELNDSAATIGINDENNSNIIINEKTDSN